MLLRRSIGDSLSGYDVGDDDNVDDDGGDGEDDDDDGDDDGDDDDDGRWISLRLSATRSIFGSSLSC